MTPEQIKRIGQALYGSRWQIALAKDIKVSRQTIRYWLVGEHEMPRGLRMYQIKQRLKKILEKKKKDVDLLLGVLYSDDK